MYLKKPLPITVIVCIAMVAQHEIVGSSHSIGNYVLWNKNTPSLIQKNGGADINLQGVGLLVVMIPRIIGQLAEILLTYC